MEIIYEGDAAIWRPHVDGVLSDYALPPVHVSLLQNLVNTSFRLQAGDLSWYLRLYAPGRYRAEEIVSEMALLEALSTVDADVPTPRRTRAGALLHKGARHGAVLSWLPGAAIKDGRQPPHYAALGEALGRLHEGADAWSPPAHFVRPVLQPFSAAVDTLREAQARWDTAGALLRESQASFGLIHADPSFGNVLYDGYRVYLIDFDDCCLGFRAYDLAVVLAGAWGKDGYGENRAALLAGYRAVRSLSPEEELALPALMAGRAASMILWLIQQDPRHPWLDGQIERLHAFLALA